MPHSVASAAPSSTAEPSRRHTVSTTLVLTVTAALLALLTWPQTFGLHRHIVIAHLISFRMLLVILLAASALTLWAILLLRKLTRRVLIAGLAVALTLTSAIHVATLVTRNAASVPSASLTLPEGDLTVLTWNTLGGAATPAEIADLVREVGADVVSLPETSADAASEVVALLGDDHPMTFSTIEHRMPTSVLLAAHLGDYRLDTAAGSTPILPSGVWVPVDADSASPPIVAAHPTPPLPQRMHAWRAGLDWLSEQCRVLGSDLVIAGDFNATVDHHGDHTGCTDAALATGTAMQGTWPAYLPTWLATPIDRVLTGEGWTVLSFDVIDRSSGSDHRPVVAVLQRG